MRNTAITVPRQVRAALPPARALALDTLVAVMNGADLQAALSTVLTTARHRANPASQQDVALATELAYGALRGRIRNQWLLGHFQHNRKRAKLPEAFNLILLLAAHELTGLDRIPAHATVNWAVESVKRGYGTTLGGLANALLRRIAELETPDKTWFAQHLAHQELEAVWHSVPEWIVDLWTQEYGEERCMAALDALHFPAAPAVRVNATLPGHRALRQRLMDDYDGTPVAEYGVLFSGRLPAEIHELESYGRLSLQSAGSQDILARLNAKNWPGPVWDACAGRGGKTMALLECGVDVRHASDPGKARLRGLAEDAQRLELPMPALRAGTAQSIAADETFFQAKHTAESGSSSGTGAASASSLMQTIVLDAPCSGLGTLARRPDILLRRTPDDIRKLAETQNSIVAACLQRLAPGGLVAYITCTLSRKENEAQVEAMQQHHKLKLEILAETPLGPDSGGYFFGALLRKGQD